MKINNQNKKIDKIKILTVCRMISSNESLHNVPVAEFIFEQNNALEKLGVEFEYYLIKRGGIKGYLFHAVDFIKFLNKNKGKFDIVHAHGGHIGSLVNIQRKVPVITTYHGSDINNLMNRFISLFALLFSIQNVFVSSKLLNKVKFIAQGIIIPCGVNFDLFKQLDKIVCRRSLGYSLTQKIVLFGGQFDRKVKNFGLAKQVIEKVGVDQIIELKGFQRETVVKVINACDCVLLTSFSEGSPMIIKEALACNKPIVSVDVGDIREITKEINNVFISDFNSDNLAQNLRKALEIKQLDIRNKVAFLDNKIIAQRVFNIYSEIINKK